jgi:hypothetical protein
MELLKSIRLFFWGVIKKLYWLLPTVILDPFDLAKRLFNVNYNVPQWSIWALFVIGWLFAMVLTYHELRMKFILNQKNNWIEKHKSEHHKLPPIPDYLVALFPNYSKDTPISKDIKIIPPSKQFWVSLYPSQQEELLDLIEWLGQDRRDYLEQIERMSPPKLV